MRLLIAAGLVAATALAVGAQDRAAELDAIFNDARFARALWGVRIESLADGRVIYTRNSDKLVVPASNMKLLTMATTAERLGWDYRYTTTLDAIGRVEDGTLHGDLIVTGSGDPSIGSPDETPSPVFEAWAEALHQAGIHRVTGRLIGDDNLFDDEGVGPGWAWDYLNDGYAAPSGALSYDENTITIRITPAAAAGQPATIRVSPAGHGLTIKNLVTTGAADSQNAVVFERGMASQDVLLRGSAAAGRAATVRTTTAVNPTQFFVDTLHAALAARGVPVRGGAWDIDALPTAPGTDGRRTIASHQSQPLSSIGAQFMKVSQNFYGEMFLKTLGARFGRAGTTVAGRGVARETLTTWGIPDDAYVMYDGSGLSRYNYVTADTIVALLKRVWTDEKHRGHFLAALPVGGHDGTLGSRMKNTALAGRVQAKTGTISNVRSLSGFLTTESGERLVFSIIGNHFTTGSAAVDEVAEKALAALVSGRRQ